MKKMTILKVRTILIGSCLSLFVCSLNAKDVYVDAFLGDSGNGSSWAEGFVTIQEALNVAVSGDNILVAGGYVKDDGSVLATNYSPDENSVFPWKEGVNLYGGYDPVTGERNYKLYTTVLRANGDRLFFTNSGIGFDLDTYIDGFTLTGATNGNNGAAAYLQYGQHLVNCTVRDNKGANGVVNLDGRPNTNQLLPSVENCEFFSNSCTSTGGAVHISYAGTVNRSVFYNNTTTSSGGAIGINGGHAYSDYDLDIYKATVANSLMFNNKSANNGGAVWSRAGDLINCTMVNNKCNYTGTETNRGGGAIILDNRGVLDVEPKVPTTITNCILWGNITTNTLGNGEREQLFFARDQLFSGEVNYCAIEDIDALQAESINDENYCINLDAENVAGPMFVSPSNYKGNNGNLEPSELDWTVQEGSPTIDAGDDLAMIYTLDLDGNARKEGTVDLGAYEYTAISGLLPTQAYNISLKAHVSANTLILSEKNIQATVYSLNGMRVASAFNCINIDISSFIPGAYLVKMETSSGVNVQKFIK